MHLGTHCWMYLLNESMQSEKELNKSQQTQLESTLKSTKNELEEIKIK